MLVLSGAAQSRGSAVGPGSGGTPGTLILSGGLTSVDQDNIVAGETDLAAPLTAVMTLTGALTWHADLGADNAQSTAFIQGFDAAASPTTGWNNLIRDTLTFANVTRNSDTIATLTLSAASGYAIIANEVVTPVMPASIIEGQGDPLTASPAITVTNVAEAIALTGTAMDSIDKDDIVDGSKTLIWTLTGDQFVTTLGADNAITTAFLAAIDSAQAEAGGWDAKVKVDLTYAMLTRDSAQQCTLVLPATTDYEITAEETVTSTPPASCLLASSSSIVASPVFTVATVGTVILADTFESGDLNSPSGAGSWWAASSRHTVSSAEAYVGTYSLQFTYGPDADGADSSAEQRFSFDTEYSEVWVEYMLLVPSNFTHRSQVSSVNNKFMQLYYYDGSDKQMLTVESERQVDNTSSLRRFLSDSELCNGNINWPTATSGVADFIGAGLTIVPGTWAQIRIHYKAASACETVDGSFEISVDGVSVNQLNWAAWDDVNAGAINGGYLMGYSNSGYALTTKFYIDDVKFYSTDPGW